MCALPQTANVLPVDRNLLRWRRLDMREVSMTEPETSGLRCRCVWRGERCENHATQEDGLCNWCGNGRTAGQQRSDPNALTGPNGEFFGIGGQGQLHDVDPNKPASTAACWYPNSDRTVLDA